MSLVDIGIVDLLPEADPDDVRDMLAETLDKDVFVLTREQFRRGEIRFWDESTPIGTIFTAGKIIGFIVGMVICYQVIYSDITDHMAEFATLKAMGYTPRYFLELILTEAVLLAIVGFIPGAVRQSPALRLALAADGPVDDDDPQLVLLVLCLTILMCMASGLLAVRKLLSADPASLF